MRQDPLTPAQRKLLEKLKGQKAAEGFYLAGGSALALALEHRRSADHDFFRRETFEPTRLRADLAETCGALKPLQIEKGTLTVEAEGVKASFFHYPYPLLKPLIEREGLFPMASLLDIALMKLTAIADRGVRKDFIDLHAILHAGATLDEVFAALPGKFPGANYQRYHFLKALTYFEDAKEEPLVFLGKPPDWEEIMAFFRREATRVAL